MAEILLAVSFLPSLYPLGKTAEYIPCHVGVDAGAVPLATLFFGFVGDAGQSFTVGCEVGTVELAQHFVGELLVFEALLVGTSQFTASRTLERLSCQDPCIERLREHILPLCDESRERVGQLGDELVVNEQSIVQDVVPGERLSRIDQVLDHAGEANLIGEFLLDFLLLFDRLNGSNLFQDVGSRLEL